MTLARGPRPPSGRAEMPAPPGTIIPALGHQETGPVRLGYRDIVWGCISAREETTRGGRQDLAQCPCTVSVGGARGDH